VLHEGVLAVDERRDFVVVRSRATSEKLGEPRSAAARSRAATPESSFSSAYGTCWRSKVAA
jgi:organic hydroperoxide reductase OsmC/OhrA